MQKLLKFTSLIFLFGLFNNGVSKEATSPKAISHTIFDDLLQKHVTPEGAVHYKGFIQDKLLFEAYLTLLQNNHPDKKSWSKNEQLAYWINAYNAFTVKIIIDNYPTKSIKDIKSGIPFINSVWDIKFIKIGKEIYDLNNIEHAILRKEFDEPRIHFAINCASYSCPKLHTSAFTAEGLEEQLAARTKDFFADKSKNIIINKDKVVLSSIMKWYSTDFTDKGFFSWLFGGQERSESLIKFINPYVDIDLNPNAEIEFMEYRWDLNE